MGKRRSQAAGGRPQAGAGRLEAIVGPMFSGKTEELIGRLTSAAAPVAVFKPAIDCRYDPKAIVTHTRRSLAAQPVAEAGELVRLVGLAVGVVGVDEAQFFGDDLPAALAALVAGGRRVVVAGLDRDFRGLPFGPMPAVIRAAHAVMRKRATCRRCGRRAFRTQRLVADAQQVLLGAAEAYEARCLQCHRPAGASVDAASPEVQAAS